MSPRQARTVGEATSMTVDGKFRSAPMNSKILAVGTSLRTFALLSILDFSDIAEHQRGGGVRSLSLSVG